MGLRPNQPKNQFCWRSPWPTERGLLGFSDPIHSRLQQEVFALRWRRAPPLLHEEKEKKWGNGIIGPLRRRRREVGTAPSVPYRPRPQCTPAAAGVVFPGPCRPDPPQIGRCGVGGSGDTHAAAYGSRRGAAQVMHRRRLLLLELPFPRICFAFVTKSCT